MMNTWLKGTLPDNITNVWGGAPVLVPKTKQEGQDNRIDSITSGLIRGLPQTNTSESLKKHKVKTLQKSSGKQRSLKRRIVKFIKKVLKRGISNPLLKKKLVHASQLRQKNLESINKQLRVPRSQTKAAGKMRYKKLLKSLCSIKRIVKSKIDLLKGAASQSLSGSLHLKKEEVKELTNKKLKCGLTVTEEGKVFVHIPKSSFACGGQKEVKLAVELFTKTLVVRGIERDLGYDPENPFKNVEGEVEVMKHCKECENIGSGLAVTAFKRDNEAVDELKSHQTGILAPFIEGGDLDGKVFSGKTLLNITLGAARGLAFMHEKRLINRDVKPENMMLSGSVVKLVDFGTTVRISEEQESQLIEWGKSTDPKVSLRFKQFTRNREGTVQFVSPETEDFGRELSEYEKSNPVEFMQKRDVYAMGLSFMAMRYGVEGNSESEKAKSLLKKAEEFKKKQNLDPFDFLIHSMIGDNPEKRPRMREVVDSLEILHRNLNSPQLLV